MVVFMKSRRIRVVGNVNPGETRHRGAQESDSYCRPFDSGLVQVLAFDSL